MYGPLDLRNPLYNENGLLMTGPLLSLIERTRARAPKPVPVPELPGSTP